jgi:hypothetical protein
LILSLTPTCTRAFSTFHESGYTNSSTVGNPAISCDASTVAAEASAAGMPSSAEMAKSAYQFVTAHMSRPDGLFNWLVSREGSTVVQNNIVLYGQWCVTIRRCLMIVACGGTALSN